MMKILAFSTHDHLAETGPFRRLSELLSGPEDPIISKMSWLLFETGQQGHGRLATLRKALVEGASSEPKQLDIIGYKGSWV